MKHPYQVALLIAILMVPLTAAGQGPGTDREYFNMDQRIDQAIEALGGDGGCAVAGQAIAMGLEILYGGVRPLPSRDLLEETLAADEKIAANERRFAEALEGYALRGDCPAQQARAFDLKQFVEQMNEVAVAVGRETRACGIDKACPGLVRHLDEETGHEFQDDPMKHILRPGFFWKLRSPFVPTNFVSGWEEDLFLTDPIPSGECVAIFKETRGLMLKLHLERIDVVRDPWATPTLARGTKIPIFSLEWMPSQYGKTWSICNTGKGLETTVTQRVKQDLPLTYFWRYFGKGGGMKH